MGSASFDAPASNVLPSARRTLETEGFRTGTVSPECEVKCPQERTKEHSTQERRTREIRGFSSFSVNLFEICGLGDQGGKREVVNFELVLDLGGEISSNFFLHQSQANSL